MIGLILLGIVVGVLYYFIPFDFFPSDGPQPPADGIGGGGGVDVGEAFDLGGAQDSPASSAADLPTPKPLGAHGGEGSSDVQLNQYFRDIGESDE